MNKRKIIRYSIYALSFIVLALIVSFAVIWIKYAILNLEISNREPDSRPNSLYYNSLDCREQLLYNAIADAAQSFSDNSEIVTYSYSMEDFQKIIKYIRADRPELFYVNFNDLVLYHSNHKTRVGMIYYVNSDDAASMKEAYYGAVGKAMEAITPEMTDFEKEVAINDYITDNCKYAIGESDPLANTAYGALVMGSAFCDGYAYAAKELLNEAGIEACVVYGTADDAEHVWNLVNIDSHYYHLDVMWNDANINMDTPLHFHGYFNLSDKEISLDHTIDDEYKILPASDFDNCYYRAIGCYAQTTENLGDIFYNALLRAASNGDRYIELECAQTKDNEEMSPYFSQALEKVNSQLGKNVLFDAFRVYEASSAINAVTIQIFYN